MTVVIARPKLQQFTDEAGKDLSAEMLSEADANWVFFGVQAGSPDPSASPIWASLESVKAGHDIKVNYDSWYINVSLLSAHTVLEGRRGTVTA